MTKYELSEMTRDEIILHITELELRSIDNLTGKINQWSRDRKIIPNSTAVVQAMKMFSEAGELADNLIKGRCPKDDLGDIYVCLCNVAALSNLTMEECVTHAYSDIKDRTGTTLPNGTFVKDKIWTT
jgi:hypothetical protein